MNCQSLISHKKKKICENNSLKCHMLTFKFCFLRVKVTCDAILLVSF